MANLDRKVSDADVYRLELGLAARAEDAGFDSVWVSEHHFSDYQLTSQQSMVLSWLAGQTTRLKLGTFVTVLPWHDPGAGRRVVLGARPPLRRPGHPRPRPRSRARRSSSASACRWASRAAGSRSTARRSSRRSRPACIEYDGELYQQPRVEIRPEPLASFKGRTFASAVSPESMEIMARMGVGLLVIAQKPWETTEAELGRTAQRYLELNGTEAPKPVLVIVAGVSKDPATIERMRNVYLQRWARSTVEHYEFDNVGFADIEGYEYYGALANNIAKHGVDKFNGFLADLQVWGTPEQVTEKLLELRRAHRRRRAGRARSSSAACRPTRRSDCFDLFATEVLPELQRHDVGGDIGVTYDAAPAAVALAPDRLPTDDQDV